MTNLTTGIHDGISDAVYHADPCLPDNISLSSTELRRITASPARFRWCKDNPPPHKRVFEFGHAAHRLALGVGSDIVVCDYDSWRTKAAQTERDDARANGQTPLLPDEWAELQQMLHALRAHPVAAALLDPDRGGKPEQTLIWQDPTGPMCRARADWFPNLTGDGRPILTDYKTAADASNNAFARAAANYGYHQQAAWYLAGVRALTGIDRPAFVFVVQEKEPPYLVNVIELDETALRIGDAQNSAAVATYLQCAETGQWPGYGPDVQLVALPRWIETRFEEEYPNAASF